MVGCANVEWSEKTNDGYRTYSNSEQYFVHKANLFGQGPSLERQLFISNLHLLL